MTTHSGQVKSNQIHLSLPHVDYPFRSGQVMSGQVKSGQVRTHLSMVRVDNPFRNQTRDTWHQIHRFEKCGGCNNIDSASRFCFTNGCAFKSGSVFRHASRTGGRAARVLFHGGNLFGPVHVRTNLSVIHVDDPFRPCQVRPPQAMSGQGRAGQGRSSPFVSDPR